MGDVLRLGFVNLLESSNGQFAVAQHDELRELEDGGRHRHMLNPFKLLIRHGKLRHRMAALQCHFREPRFQAPSKTRELWRPRRLRVLKARNHWF